MLLLGGTAALAGCGGSDLAVLKTLPSGTFAEVDGTRLHYRVLGLRGPKVIAIHGASGNLLDWAIGPGAEIANTHQVLLFDRPGLGFSQRPDGGSSPFVQADLMQRAAEQVGFGRATLVGHSYGGSVALAWALSAPDSLDGLLLLSAPSHVWPGGVGLIFDLSANPVTGPALARAAAALVSQRTIQTRLTRIFEPQSPPPGYFENVGVDLAIRPATFRANGADLSNLKSHIRNMVPRYDELTLPVEILHGSADDIVPADLHSDKLAKRLPQARYSRLAGIGHMPHHVATDAVLAALNRLTGQA